MGDTYQLKLKKIGSGADPEDWRLQLVRTAGTECSEISSTWLNTTWWLPPYTNGMLSAWDTQLIQEGVNVPCTPCISPKRKIVTPPCMESLCIVDDDYDDCPPAEGTLVYEPQEGPSGLRLKGLQFDVDRITDGGGGACELELCGELYSRVNSFLDGVVMAFQDTFNWWEKKSGVQNFQVCDPPGTHYWEAFVRFSPCDFSGEDPVHRGLLTVDVNVGSFPTSLGTGDYWYYYLHVPADGQISLFDKLVLQRMDFRFDGGDCSFSGDATTVVPATITMEPVA